MHAVLIVALVVVLLSVAGGAYAQSLRPDAWGAALNADEVASSPLYAQSLTDSNARLESGPAAVAAPAQSPAASVSTPNGGLPGIGHRVTMTTTCNYTCSTTCGVTCAATCVGNYTCSTTCVGTSTCAGSYTCNATCGVTCAATCVGNYTCSTTCVGTTTCAGSYTCNTTCGVTCAATCVGNSTCSTTCAGTTTCAGSSTCAGAATCATTCGAPTVTAPNGGQTWQVGSSQTITWTPGSGASATIELSRTGSGGSWEPIVSDTANDGTYLWTVNGPASTDARIRVTTPDGSDMSDASFTIDAAAGDSTPPTTTVHGAGSSWHKSAVVLTFTPTDNTGGSGMSGGAAKTEYSTDDGATWTTGTSVKIAAPADHSRDGIHPVSYRSTDAAGNVETAKSCEVRIDTLGPACQAKRATVKRYELVQLDFAVNDVTSPQVRFTIKIKTLGGVTKKSTTSTWADANNWFWWRFICKLKKGTYLYYVTARDLAGNPQSRGASARLVVR